MKPVFLLLPLTFAALASCALDSPESDTPTAGAGGTAGGGSGSGGTAGAAGGKANGGTTNGGTTNGGSEAGGRAGSANGGRNASAGEGGTGDDSGGDAGDGGGGSSGSAGTGNGEGGMGGDADGGTAGSASGGTAGANAGGAGLAGSGGSAGSVGGAGGSAGASGSGGTGGMPENDTPIQLIQSGAITTGAVTINRVFVTATIVKSNGNVNLTLQEPQGATTSGIAYPAYSGIYFHVPAADVSTLPALTGIAVGDCVSFSGTISEFHSVTEIYSVTSFVRNNVADCVGGFPTPYDMALAPIASDTEPNTAGEQPGVSAEIYEQVLVRLVSVSVQGTNADGFRMRAASGVQTLLVHNFYSALPSVTANQAITSIVGIYDQFDNYRLLPRSSADITF